LFCADPPWDFETRTPAGQGRSPSRHYSTLDFAALCRLPVAQIAAPNALLALWVYNVRLFDADRLAAAWGFPDFGGVLFTWSKTARNGAPRIGTGFTTRKNTEQCLLFKRGKGLPRLDRGVPELIQAPRREHSEKPLEAMARLERLYGDVRRIGLFARTVRPDWDAWGDQVAACTVSTPLMADHLSAEDRAYQR
jgi:N6-adenosine-specific RNA methylase IME4